MLSELLLMYCTLSICQCANAAAAAADATAVIAAPPAAHAQVDVGPTLCTPYAKRALI